MITFLRLRSSQMLRRLSSSSSLIFLFARPLWPAGYGQNGSHSTGAAHKNFYSRRRGDCVQKFSWKAKVSDSQSALYAAITAAAQICHISRTRFSPTPLLCPREFHSFGFGIHSLFFLIKFVVSLLSSSFSLH